MTPAGVMDVLQSAAAASVVVRLVHLKLVARFPALLAWLTVFSLSTFVSLLVGGSAVIMWRAYAAVFLVCSACAVMEIVNLTFDRHAGIRLISHWTLYVTLAVGVVCQLLMWHYFRASLPSDVFYLRAIGKLFFSVACVAAMWLGIAWRYGPHLQQSTCGMSFWIGAVLLSQCFEVAVESLSPDLLSPTVHFAIATFSTGCLAVGGALLTRDPERTGFA
jgi:hypothetical protein